MTRTSLARQSVVASWVSPLGCPASKMIASTLFSQSAWFCSAGGSSSTRSGLDVAEPWNPRTTSYVKLYPTPLVPMPTRLPPQSWKSRSIGASDDGKCFPVESDQGAQLRIGTSGRERSLTMKSGIGDVGLRKAKICISAFDASDVRHRAIGTHPDAWHRLMLAPQIKHLADRASDGMVDAAGRPGGESNRGRSEGNRDRRAARNGARHDRRGTA